MAINIGIIGAGNLGHRHTEILKKDERVNIIGVTDIVIPKAKELAESIGGRVFQNVDELLGADIDALYITTPNIQHASVVLSALERDIHVFCEKPMAISLREARQILESTRTSKAIYQVGHNRRFAPVYQYLKKQIEKGFKPFLANAMQNDGDLLYNPWVIDPYISGGFLYETSVHMLDILRWLMGDAISTRVKAKVNVYGILDDFAMLITFVEERFAVFSTSAHASWAFPSEHLEIVGEHAFVRCEGLDRVVYSPGLNSEVVSYDYTHLSKAIKWGFYEEDRLFISACLNENPSAVNAEEAYKSIELCEACYRSAANGGEEIKIPLYL